MNIYESIDDFNRVMKKPRKSRLVTCVMSIIKSCDVSGFNPYHIRKQTEHYCDIFVFNEMIDDNNKILHTKLKNMFPLGSPSELKIFIKKRLLSKKKLFSLTNIKNLKRN